MHAVRQSSQRHALATNSRLRYISSASRLGAFNKQFWSIKRQHADLVLFVKVGAFYELVRQGKKV